MTYAPKTRFEPTVGQKYFIEMLDSHKELLVALKNILPQANSGSFCNPSMKDIKEAENAINRAESLTLCNNETYEPLDD